MLSDLTGELARQRIADLHAEADRWRLAGRVHNRAAVPRIILLFAGEPRRGSRAVGPTYTISPTHPASAEMEGNIMTSSTKRRLFQGVGAALAAIAMSATLAVNAAARMPTRPARRHRSSSACRSAMRCRASSPVRPESTRSP